MQQASLCFPELSSLPPVEPSIINGDAEVWSVLPFYQANLVSSHGRVWSRVQKRLRSTNRIDGYYVNLSQSKGAGFSVHRAVATAFVPGKFDKAVVNHRDGIKNNNVWTNLEWVTHAENNRHARASGLNPTKLSDKQVKELRDRVSSTSDSFKEIGEDFGIHGVSVAMIARGQIRGYKPVDLTKRPLRGKLSEEQAREVIKLLQEMELTYAEIAERYDVSSGNIANIAAGRVWPHLSEGLDLRKDRSTWKMRRKRGT